jgi:ABC-type antimicrobial peptide transport system permease subunit
VGIAGAFALTRVLKSLPFHVRSTDPATFASIALLFVVAALAAGYAPARRAARVDPMTALWGTLEKRMPDRIHQRVQ